MGQLILFNTYLDAKGFLYECIGSYCSYCEGFISNAAVEHKLSQKTHPHLEKKWNNFLLSCTNCNSTKRHHQHFRLQDCLWPDKDNTYLAFIYNEGGQISINCAITPAVQNLADQTMRMTGIGAIPSNDLRINPKQRDKRWENRRDAWEIAVDAKKDLGEVIGIAAEVNMRKRILSEAIARGFWSVWMSVFADDPIMKNHLINQFCGTCKTCFDSNINPVPRRRRGTI